MTAVESAATCRHCGVRIVARVEEGGDYPGDNVRWLGRNGEHCDLTRSNQSHEPLVTRESAPDARRREVRNAIAFGAMAASSWGPDAGEDGPLLDDLTDQYLAQDGT